MDLAAAVDRRREAVTARWALDDEIVLVRSGHAPLVEGSDLHHAFRPHPDFAYLSGTGVEGAVLAYDARTGEWQLFGPRFTADQLVWEPAPTEIGLPVGELDEWLGQRADQRVLEAVSDAAVQSGIGEVRLHKDEAELADLRRAAITSEAGFDWVYANTRPGMTEREVQIGMEAEFFRAGAVRPAYPSILASGPHGAYLHYFYGLDDALRPATRTIEAGDLLLIDAGGEVGGYASDVTRTMFVGAEPTDVQTFLWNLVLRAQEVAIDRCRPGQEWREVHMESARIIGSGLIELGALRGEVDELISSGAVALFFPHGLGHLIGLAVHDAGGYPAGREPSAHPQLRYLRTDRPLEAGMITSVEPGVYFIEALLGDPAQRERFADQVVWEVVDPLRGFGGIRIEDDVHITDGEPEVLSAAIAKPLRIG